MVMMKDNPYTIFHALGKFLYNKSKSFNWAIKVYRSQSEDREDRVATLWNDEKGEEAWAIL